MSESTPALDELRRHLNYSRSNEAAWAVVTEYFRFFNPDDVHEELWLLRAGTIINKCFPYESTETERQDLIFFFEFNMLLAEAVYRLYTSHQLQAAKKRKWWQLFWKSKE